MAQQIHYFELLGIPKHYILFIHSLQTLVPAVSSILNQTLLTHPELFGCCSLGKHSFIILLYHSFILPGLSASAGCLKIILLTYYTRGVKLIFMRGHISLMVAFKEPNVILGLHKCNYSLTRDKEFSTAAG